MLNIRKTLEKKTKQELLDFIDDLIENKILDSTILGNYLTPAKMSMQEIEICEAVQKKEISSLSMANKNYLTEKLDSCENRKIKLVLSGRDKFLSFLLEHKINYYFDKIWTLYPKKAGKKEGYKAFLKLIQDKKVSELVSMCKYVAQKVVAYKEQCESRGTEEQFIQFFSTFCNSRKYL